MRWIKKKIVSPLNIERTNLQIFGRLISRNPRYLGIILPMYAHSPTSVRQSHHLRSAYCFARYIDDLLDGDISCPTDQSPHQFIVGMLTDIDHDNLENANKITKLGDYVFRHLEQLERDSVSPTRELRKLIQHMLFDRLRIDHRLLLSAESLSEHHLGIFCSALHVTLCISGADYLPIHIQPLARAQACLYSIRDLEEDLNKSINNIPHSVLTQTGFNDRDDAIWDPSVLLKSPPIQRWIQHEINEGQQQLLTFKAILSNHDDAQFRKTLRPLFRGLTYLTGKLDKQYAPDAESISERPAYAN